MNLNDNDGERNKYIINFSCGNYFFLKVSFLYFHLSIFLQLHNFIMEIYIKKNEDFELRYSKKQERWINQNHIVERLCRCLEVYFIYEKNCLFFRDTQ